MVSLTKKSTSTNGGTGSLISLITANDHAINPVQVESSISPYSTNAINPAQVTTAVSYT